jgi:NTP pyrophosphatase (non-canonical NTP hydrolase)
MLTWKESADIVHRTVASGLEPYGKQDLRFLSLFLAGEVGEFCNLIKKEWMEEFGVAKSQGDKKDSIRLELADIRICLELLAKCVGVDLDAACAEKLAIYEARWKEAGEAVRKAEEYGCCGHPKERHTGSVTMSSDESVEGLCLDCKCRKLSFPKMWPGYRG